MPKRAIELKADSYLLKPIKIPELKSALKTGRERNLRGSGDRADFFAVENIMLACMHGQVRQNSQLNKQCSKKYGVSLEEPVRTFWCVARGQLQKTEVVDQADFGNGGGSRYTL